MTTPLRAAAYLRVSSDRQREAGSIESSRRDVPAYIAAQGWTLAGIYEDDGRSAAPGKLAKRTDFARLAADCEAGKIDVVALAHMDRLSRADRLEREMILHAITSTGAKVAIVGAGILDPDTLAGEVMLSMGGIMAAQWLREHRKRVIAGRLTAIGRGRKPAGPTPYGYRYSRADHAWSVHDGEAAAIREVYERLAAGDTCYAIARDLDARGIKRRRGGWSHNAVSKVARVETYVGRWVADRKRELVIPVPRLVSSDLRDAAIANLRARAVAGLRQTRHVYLLEAVATCALCGAPIGIESGVTPKSPPPYPGGPPRQIIPARYSCHRRRRPDGAGRCELPYHRTADVDAMLWGEIEHALCDPVLVDEELRRIRSGGVGAPDPRLELGRARAEIARLAKVEADLLDRFGAGRITPAALDAQLDRLAANRLKAEQSAADAERAASDRRAVAVVTESLEVAIAAVRARAERATPEERKALTRELNVAAAIGVRSLRVAVDLPGALLGLVSHSGSRTVGRNRALPYEILLPERARLTRTWADYYRPETRAAAGAPS